MTYIGKCGSHSYILKSASLWLQTWKNMLFNPLIAILALCETPYSSPGSGTHPQVRLTTRILFPLKLKPTMFTAGIVLFGLELGHVWAL